MGKRLIQQRRGRGTPRYRSPSHRYAGAISYKPLDQHEQDGFIKGKVMALINSVGHSAPLMLVKYETGHECLQVAPEGIAVDDIVYAGSKAPVSIGNILPLASIPEGTEIFCIELRPGDGGKIVRTAGSSARVVSKVPSGVAVLLPSKKTKILYPNCRATVGKIAGSGRKEKPFVKAGNKYHAMKARGKLYPRTSAVAMNAVDHPFGSGRGRHKGRCSVPKRNAPPGAKVGLIRAKRTGKRK